MLEDVWADVDLPVFFSEPPPDSDDTRLWELALTVTEDLFGSESRELRLLQRGIAVHHGRGEKWRRRESNPRQNPLEERPDGRGA